MSIDWILNFFAVDIRTYVLPEIIVQHFLFVHVSTSAKKILDTTGVELRVDPFTGLLGLLD